MRCSVLRFQKGSVTPGWRTILASVESPKGNCFRLYKPWYFAFRSLSSTRWVLPGKKYRENWMHKAARNKSIYLLGYDAMSLARVIGIYPICRSTRSLRRCLSGKQFLTLISGTCHNLNNRWGNIRALGTYTSNFNNKETWAHTKLQFRKGPLRHKVHIFLASVGRMNLWSSRQTNTASKSKRRVFEGFHDDSRAEFIGPFLAGGNMIIWSTAPRMN